MKRTVVVFANPFGYGPSGKALAVIEQLKNHLHQDSIVFAGEGLCLEIVRHARIKMIPLDQRNEQVVRKFLSTIDSPFVFSSQNRFAIRAAQSMGIPSAFLDGLAWFWQLIPADHLLADVIFWLNYPEIKSKIPAGFPIETVGAITGILPAYSPTLSHILIHLGGGENPFTADISVSYLNLVAQILNKVPIHWQKRLIIAGGKRTTEYLALKVDSKTMNIGSFPRDHFLKLLSQANHFITTAGQTATLEAFSIGVPTSFLLPTNLSQYALTELLEKYNAAPKSFSWSSYTDADFLRLTEKEGIDKIELYARTVQKDARAMNQLNVDFIDLLQNIPNAKRQEKFIKSMGKRGAEQIAIRLKEIWHLH